MAAVISESRYPVRIADDGLLCLSRDGSLIAALIAVAISILGL